MTVTTLHAAVLGTRSAVFQGWQSARGCFHLLCRIRQIMLPSADKSSKRGTEDGRQPEQPKLCDIDAAGEQCRAGAPRRIDRSVGDRDQEQMNERQTEPDGYSGKSDSRAF